MNNNGKKYFLVTAKCGHVGRNKYTIQTFAIMAYSKKEASAICRQIPRVKHDRKDAIISCVETSVEGYYYQKEINDGNLYFHVHNIQDQKINWDCSGNIYYEEQEEIEYTDPEVKKEIYKHKRRKEELNYMELMDESDDYFNNENGLYY